MKIAQDLRFREQRELFALRFTCEHCALYDPGAVRCAHDWPTEEHRLAWYGDPDAPLVFCKDFHLL